MSIVRPIQIEAGAARGAPSRPTTAPIRVFHLFRHLGRAGAELLLVEGLRFADRENFHYGYGYVMHGDGVLPEFEALGASLCSFGATSRPGILAAAGRIARHLRDWQADLVHCHLPLVGAAGRLAGRLAGVPVVYTEHNVWERYHPLTRLANRLTWPMQAHVVAVSEQVARSVRARVADRVPVHVIHNGVDVDRFHRDPDVGQEMRTRLGVPPTACLVTNVASFKPQKRLDRWLRAAQLIRRARPDTRFLLIGGGPKREAMRRLAARLGLSDVVHFIGVQRDVRPYLACTDVFMMSSDFEGMPVAMLEAMAFECAIVSTPAGGIPEAVTDGRTGLLVPSQAPEEMAAATIALLDDPARRRELGRAARSEVAERFHMRHMCQALERLYAQVMVERGRAAVGAR